MLYRKYFDTFNLNWNLKTTRVRHYESDTKSSSFWRLHCQIDILKWNCYIAIQISLKFSHNDKCNSKPTFAQKVVSSDRPLYDKSWHSVLKHIYFSWPQCIGLKINELPSGVAKDIFRALFVDDLAICFRWRSLDTIETFIVGRKFHTRMGNKEWL